MHLYVDSLSANPEETVAPGLAAKLAAPGAEPAGVALEEGYLDLAVVKEIVLGGRDRDKDPDLATACRRYGLDRFTGSECSLSLVYGVNLSDNRVLFLLCPPILCRYVCIFLIYLVKWCIVHLLTLKAMNILVSCKIVFYYLHSTYI
jgi:phosphatidylinositol phospholipase C epsilon